ncbi:MULTISPECIES: TauD/TfdA family dioxygenase [Halomonas]|uniref:Gamma-butyrobetaine,2-oxoglutarate dioxygenase n=1 Tax=Halomonas halophila TaxID=29573 RepID=A0ABQ0U111_9GAMM|nr:MULTISPECIES: TauD/TfdA family dioxygenase [Halomonas]MDR5888702.1 TauD/TfdA family dioxygenase [Halomonas salina]WJY07882.1 TauD/TfdA family dioxygenase [Halomonas halophila]GEK71935.1 gamma-butyrobetaine,2-oxoglutarate dioxygenase [Halomonas halophila]
MTDTPTAEARPSVPMAELDDHAGGPGLVEASAAGARLTLSWEDGERAAFPLTWLRDHCACAECRHPMTRERLYMGLEVPDTPEVRLEDGNLTLTWADGHVSRFDAGWLQQRRPGQTRPDAVPTRRPWREDFRPVRVAHADFVAGTEGERAWLTALLRDGLVLLEDGPLADEEVSRLAGRIGPLRATNFGARFDVRSKPNPNNAAYTAIGLALHTDLPNWRHPPDIQLLYCLENDAEGGESTFVDGFAAAEKLRRQDPEAFRRLAETPIDFRFQDEEHDIVLTAPLLSLDTAGNVTEVRLNNWIRDTLRLPLEQIDAWYDAYRAFWQLTQDPDNRLEFALAPGQMVAFDNRRVLHGRLAFNPESGRRHLQGTYLDLDLCESRLRVLARQG